MALTIEDIITRKEGQTFDCKSVQIEPKALAVPIVAMANADGGTIAIGVSDKTRRIEGVDGNEKRLNDLLRVPFYREPNVHHTFEPKVHIDAFILKVTVNKNSCRLIENTPGVIENNEKLTEKVPENIDVRETVGMLHTWIPEIIVWQAIHP